MSFNELLIEAGDFGLYQKFLCFGFLGSSLMVVAFSFWSQVFTLLIAPHRCRVSPTDSWSKNLSVYGGVVVEQCQIRFDTSRESKLLNLQQLISSQEISKEPSNSTWVTIPCPYGWVYDYSVLYPTISTERNWVCSEAWEMYTVHTCYWVGAVCGYAFFGTFSDRFGRKRSYQASIVLTIIADACALFVNSHLYYAITRFFSAMGQGNISTVAFVLVMEYTGPRRRLLVLGVWCLTWTCMSALVPVLPYLIRYWRWILGFSILPCSIVLLLSHCVPESASWLITRKRLDKAAYLIHRMASVNGKEDMSLEYITEKLEKQAKDDETVCQNGNPHLEVAVISVENNSEKKKERHLTYSQAIAGLFRTPNMRKKTILLILLWMIACGCYNGNTIEIGNLPFNVYLSYSIGAILEAPSNIFCILALDKIGRRWGNFVFFTIAGIAAVISGLLKPDPRIVLILAMIVRSGLAAGFDITFTFSSESFPTEVRGRGISIIRVAGGIGSAVAPMIVSLSESDPLLPLAVFGFLSLFAAVATLFIPETAGQHLPHTLEEGEAFGKDQRFFFCQFSLKQDSTPPEILRKTGEITTEDKGTINYAIESDG